MPISSHTFELLDTWHFAAADATLALANWHGAPRGQKRLAHAVYVAALDREEVAARELQRNLGA